MNPFTRYLAAKKTVDDRALNEQVWQAMVTAVRDRAAVFGRPLRVLELGGGIGTMAERWQERLVLASVEYTLLDAEEENIKEATRRLGDWEIGDWKLEAVDVLAFARRERGRQTWDLLIAHAFLDLLDVSQALPLFFELLEPGGLFYFTINFDGETILEPAIEPAFDEFVMQLYHQTMDERVVDGRPSGDSRTGRHLFRHLTAAGGQILAAGSSDWVVYAQNGRYTADEAYFLHFIIETIKGALAGHPLLDDRRFAEWINQRQQQVMDGTLVYIAHQLDFFGRYQQHVNPLSDPLAVGRSAPIQSPSSPDPVYW